MDISFNCAVCYKDIAINKLVNTTCNHQYCNTCFFRWIFNNRNCPLCRHKIVSKPNAEESNALAELRRLYEWEYQLLMELQSKIEEKEDINRQLTMDTQQLQIQKNNLTIYIANANRAIRQHEYQRNRNRNRLGTMFFY